MPDVFHDVAAPDPSPRLVRKSFVFPDVPLVAGANLKFMNHHHTPIEVGKYRVSPLARELDGGTFSASVSIRSGRGSATHDRVSRFSTLFDNAPAALHYATEQALVWIGERHAPAGAAVAAHN